MAERLEIGVLVGEFFEIVIEFDGATNVGLCGGEIPPLGSVTTEVELDEGVFGVEAGGIGEDFRGGLEGVAPTFGESPSDEPAGFVGVVGGKASGQAGGILPAAGSFEEAQFKFLDAIIQRHLRGEMVEFGEGIGIHT